MAHAEDLAYLRSKMGAAEFERLIEEWVSALRGLEAERASHCLEVAQNVHSGEVSDTYLRPAPIRIRTPPREKRLTLKAG